MMLTMMNYDPVSLRILDELANTPNSLHTKDLMALCRLTRKQTFTRISILKKGYIISRNRQNYCYSMTSYGRLVYQKLTELNNLLSNMHRYRSIDIMKKDKNISSNELRDWSRHCYYSTTKTKTLQQQPMRLIQAQTKQLFR